MAETPPPPPGFTLDQPGSAPPPPPPGFKLDAPQKLGLGQALRETGSQLYDIFVEPVVKGAISGGKKVTGQDTSGIGQNLTDEELQATMALGGVKAPGGKPTMLPKGSETPKPEAVPKPAAETPGLKQGQEPGPIPEPPAGFKLDAPGPVSRVTQPIKDALEPITDDLKRIFAPAERTEGSKAVAGMVREGQATREQSYQKAAENLRNFGNAVGQLPPAERFAFMDAIETGATEGMQGTPLGRLAGEIRGYFDSRWLEMEQRGIAPNYVQDYFPHLWKDPGTAAKTFQQYYGKGPSLEGRKAFTKERKFSTIREGMDSGLVPVTDNPIELSLMQLHQMDKYITAHDVFEEMKASGYAEQFPPGERPPPGWIMIDDKIARRGNAPYFAPEPAATIVNRYLSPGLGGKPVYDTIRTAGNMMNMAQLGLSAFHAAFVAADAATSTLAKGVKQISRLKPAEMGKGIATIASTPGALVMRYLTGAKVLKQYLGTGQYGKEMAQIVDSLIAGGGKARMDEFYRSSASGSFWNSFKGSLQATRGQPGRMTLKQDLAQMIRDNGPGGKLAMVKTAAQIIPRVMDTMMAPIMQDIVPKMKLGVFYDLMADELRVNPNMTRPELRQVAGRVWDSVDNRLGQLNYDNLFWNKMMRDVGHIAVRSLGWNLGTIRELGGGVADLAKGRMTSPEGMKQLTDRASYVIAMPILTAMMGSVYGYMKTGKAPETVKDMMFPKTGGVDAQGGENRANMPGYMKDAVEWGMQPGQTAKGKVHPLWPAIYQMMNNEQWNGAAITDPDQPLPKNIGDYSKFIMQQFAPLSLRSPPNAAGASGISGTERFFGLREAPYRIREPEISEGYERKVLSRKVKKFNKQESADQ